MLLKNFVFSINFLFSSNSLLTNYSIYVLNVFRSIAQNLQFPTHLIEAVLGLPYNKANSPNPSPSFNSRTILSLIIT